MEKTTYTTQDVPFRDLRIGMQTACHMLDGTIEPSGRITAVAFNEYDGSYDYTVTYPDGSHWNMNESAERIENDSRIQIAVKA